MKAKFSRFFRSHIGKITGVLLGLLLGLRIFGALFGFLLGYLSDILIRQLRLRRAVRTPESILQSRRPSSARIRFVLRTGWYVMHCAQTKAEPRADAETETDVEPRADAETHDETEPRAEAAAQAEAATAGGPRGASSGAPLQQRDIDFLKELCFQTLPLSTEEAAVLGHLFDTYKEDPRQLPSLAELDVAPDFHPRPADQIAVSRLLFEATLMGSEATALSGRLYRFVYRACFSLGLEKRYIEATAGILQVKHSSSYELLGVKPDTPLHEIKRVYRSLAGQFHPDSLHGLSPEQKKTASEAFVRIRDAYEAVLRDQKDEKET